MRISTILIIGSLLGLFLLNSCEAGILESDRKLYLSKIEGIVVKKYIFLRSGRPVNSIVVKDFFTDTLHEIESDPYKWDSLAVGDSLYKSDSTLRFYFFRNNSSLLEMHRGYTEDELDVYYGYPNRLPEYKFEQ